MGTTENDWLCRIEAKLDRALEALARHQATIEIGRTRIDDHETRLRVLESRSVTDEDLDRIRTAPVQTAAIGRDRIRTWIAVLQWAITVIAMIVSLWAAEARSEEVRNASSVRVSGRPCGPVIVA
mgnify:CR=1 FL=1